MSAPAPWQFLEAQLPPVVVLPVNAGSQTLIVKQSTVMPPSHDDGYKEINCTYEKSHSKNRKYRKCGCIIGAVHGAQGQPEWKNNKSRDEAYQDMPLPFLGCLLDHDRRSWRDNTCACGANRRDWHAAVRAIRRAVRHFTVTLQAMYERHKYILPFDGRSIATWPPADQNRRHQDSVRARIKAIDKAARETWQRVWSALASDAEAMLQ